MAQIPDKITSIINQFLTELKKNNISVEQAFLFGSYARGTSTEWSDIDLAIISPDFEGDRFKDRNKIRRIKLKISCDPACPLPAG
jgi:predicted nucleotidyltransferase